MTIYGQNWGDFKRENNECIVTGAREKLHKIKIVVLSTYFFYLCAAMTRFRHEIRHSDVKMTYFVTKNVS